MIEATDINDIASSYKQLVKKHANREPLQTYLWAFPIIDRRDWHLQPLKAEIEEEELHMISLRLKKLKPVPRCIQIVPKENEEET